MKRALVTAVAAASMAVGATAADAAVTKGKFKGATAKDDPMGLRVDGKQRVYLFFYDDVRLRCSDGDRLNTPRIQTPRGTDARFQIGDDRRWGIRARNRETGFGWDVSGRFNLSGTKTTGTLTIVARFNKRNRQDPNGSIRCRATDLEFTLRRQ